MIYRQPFFHQMIEEELQVMILASLCFFSLLSMLLQDAFRKIIVTTSATVIHDNNKKKPIVQYPCYICANKYSDEIQVIDHIKKTHAFIKVERLSNQEEYKASLEAEEQHLDNKGGQKDELLWYEKSTTTQLTTEEHICDDQGAGGEENNVPSVVAQIMNDSSREIDMDDNNGALAVFGPSSSHHYDIDPRSSGDRPSLITVHQDGLFVEREIVKEIVVKLEDLTALFRRLIDAS